MNSTSMVSVTVEHALRAPGRLQQLIASGRRFGENRDVEAGILQNAEPGLGDLAGDEDLLWHACNSFPVSYGFGLVWDESVLYSSTHG